MEKIVLKKIDISELISKNDVDIIICSSGYEIRASFFAKMVSEMDIKHKYVLSFKDQKNVNNRKKNDRLFTSLNYEFIENEKDNNDFINILLPIIIELSRSRSIKILIDYSSMTRTWFATFVNILKYISDNIILYFSYSLAKFNSPIQSISPSIKFDPIPGFNNVSIPDRPTALIIGLGYEKNRAAGLIEYFDAEEVFLFHTDSNEYKNHVRSANKSIIRQVKEDNIIPYPLNDIEYTHTILINLCKELNNNYRIIIAPSGPKVFSIIAFILGIQLEYVDIWRISGEYDPLKENRIPSGKTIIFSIQKENNLSPAANRVGG